MRISLFIIKALLAIFFLFSLILVVFFGYRYFSFNQNDNQARVDSKRLYLENIAQRGAPSDAPNIIFILYDDMGFGDIGVGAIDTAAIKTPNIDALAAEGVMLSDFHSPSPVCTPSRAGFLTGRLAPRAGLPNVVFPSGSLKELFISRFLFPNSNVRIPHEEITIADVLSAAGYRTGLVGKWHLGDVSPSLPNNMGFDSFFGSLYSNDMEQFAIYRDQSIEIDAPADQSMLTRWYTDEAISFIRDDDQPFFLYFAHNFPHDPLSVRETRLGSSNGGLYGDVLEEIDDGVGEIVEFLRETEQLNNTLIILTSDNGPWFQGNVGGQRGRKGSTFEGGMRVPFITHWPARIQGGRVESAMAIGTDLLPTILDILALPAPEDRILDGQSMLPTLVQGHDSSHKFIHYMDGETLFAVRNQRFKYRAASGVVYSMDQLPMAVAIPQKEWLFDLQLDPRESYDVSARHPAQLAMLRKEFQRKQAELSENKRGWKNASTAH